MANWRQARESNGWTWEYADLRTGRWCRVTLKRGLASGWQATVTVAATAQFQSVTFEVVPPGAHVVSAPNFERLQDFLSASGFPPFALQSVIAALHPKIAATAAHNPA